MERLAKMIKRESQQAKFLVVSLRDLRMERSERTIGVTQAREADAPASALKMAK